ncbi:hypothetical protein DB728_20345 [Rhizobium leguminosarum bv. viciae USDA 2370]|nr:hypothetical protein BS629_16175 [Rhizobium leguminosarum bv. viciae USDA 2370]PUB63987.1 hypothetical protein DB728_20345 [Rhizobium leguminosarum bv. viciae USDA 2370]
MVGARDGDIERPSVKYAWVKDFGHGITVSCERGRSFRVDEGAFRKRYVTLKFARDDALDAHAMFFEWSTPAYPVDEAEFFDVADSQSQEDYEMAAVLEQCWGDAWEHPLDCGSVVVFHRLVVPRPMPGFWPTMRSAIKREFSRRAAMMMLKAFPLEWEGRFHDPAAPGMDDFERRSRAMAKHYQRQLEVSPIPVAPNFGQWMWLPIRFDYEPREGAEPPSRYLL